MSSSVITGCRPYEVWSGGGGKWREKTFLRSMLKTHPDFMVMTVKCGSCSEESGI
jgi:hypothetical protein